MPASKIRDIQKNPVRYPADTVNSNNKITFVVPFMSGECPKISDRICSNDIHHQHKVFLRAECERDFEEWLKKHNEELKTMQISGLFRDKGGTSVVSGEAGIGKSTMVRKIVHDWVSGSKYLQFHFVFWFKFQNLNTIEGKTNLSSMVRNYYSHFRKELEDMWDSPESLLFIFDGLDQFKVKVDFGDKEKRTGTETHFLDPEGDCEVADIVQCLVRGTMLRGCSVLITSQPEALETLRQVQLDLWRDIFFDKGRVDHVSCCFNENSMALKRAKETDILYTMGFDPSGDRIICKSLPPVFTQLDGNPQLLQTATQLFSNFICNVLKDDQYLGGKKPRREALLQAAGVVNEGGWKPCTDFTEDHRDLISGFGMNILELDEGAESCVYNLYRLTFREYLAALAQYFTPEPPAVEALLDQVSLHCPFHPFVHFLIGLSALMSGRLEDLVGPLCPETASKVSAWLSKELEKRPHHLDDVSSKRELMDLFHFLSESQDVELMRQTMRSLEALNFGDTYPEEALRLSVVDCFVLARIMEPCDTVGEMYFSNCSVQAEGIQRLLPMIHKCTNLNLWGNNLGDSGVKRLSTALRNPECHIQKLCLSSNGLTAACTEDLVSALSVNLSLTELFLDYNNLRDSGVKGLAVALRNSECKIQNLGLEGNSLTADCIEDLVFALSTNLSLTKLNLNNNNLGDSGMKQLSVALRNPECKIQKLELHNIGLTDVCIEDLTSALISNRSLKQLVLGMNSFTDMSVPPLRALLLSSTCLEWIWLSEHQFSAEGIKELRSLRKSRRGLRVCV